VHSWKKRDPEILFPGVHEIKLVVRDEFNLSRALEFWIMSNSTSASQDRPDDDEGRDNEGSLDPLVISLIILISIFAVIALVFFVLSRRIKDEDDFQIMEE
ncbi:MAG: hypothetical protein U9R75_11585, partial [Candidatus Thermoplasmatota archaeon]|nr:hypothetical protein [Candidatus Thermoplasmatota archaeon]